MNMNYFRLLFSRWGECLVHFGEWKDTRTGDKFTFLYLGAKQEPVSQKPVNQKNEGSGHTLFLCPKYVDFLVLGEKNEAVLSIAREIVRETAVGTLVYPGGMEVSETAGAAGETEEPDKPEYDLSEIAGADGEIENPDESEYDSSEIAGADGEAENSDEPEQDFGEAVRERICLSPRLGCEAFSVSAVGWRFSVFCCESEAVGESALAVFYAPEKEQMPLFEDCVMSVKYMDGRQRCAVLGEPDEYGCAMGCARHCDYDVCGCDRKDGQLACLLGTMLFPLSGIRRLPDEASKADFGEARFFTVTDSGLISDLSSEALSRRYLICVDDSLSDAALGKICRGDGFVAPVYLREDRGICCSGFLKYI